MTDALLKTALHDKHVALEASMGETAGWEMPLAYRGAIDEAMSVRRRAGVFDIGHSGRIRIRGDGALDLLERVCTHDVAHQEDNTSARTLMLNERGGILDICRLVRLEDSWLLIASPINRTKIVEHMQSLAEGFSAQVDDRTQKDAALLVAGPTAPALLDAVLEGVLGEKVSQLSPDSARAGTHLLARYVVVRTDELGFWSAQVILPHLLMGQAWRYITQKAGDGCIAPAGLAAWDVLRIEAGQSAYGQEINESFDPYLAGVGSLVDLGHEFIGADACRTLSARTPPRRLVGLVICSGKASVVNRGQSPKSGDSPLVPIPRQGSAVLDFDGNEIGAVTSGTFSPLLDCPVALAYVAKSAAAPQTPVTILQDGATHSAQIVALPFSPVK